MDIEKSKESDGLPKRVFERTNNRVRDDHWASDDLGGWNDAHVFIGI